MIVSTPIGTPGTDQLLHLAQRRQVVVSRVAIPLDHLFHEAVDVVDYFLVQLLRIRTMTLVIANFSTSGIKRVDRKGVVTLIIIVRNVGAEHAQRHIPHLVLCADFLHVRHHQCQRQAVHRIIRLHGGHLQRRLQQNLEVQLNHFFNTKDTHNSFSF